MKINLLSKILFSAFLAFTLSTFLYFSFGNIYSSKILNYQEFTAQFSAGIYQYRILSSYLLFGVYDILSAVPIDYEIYRFKFFSSAAEPQMYLAFYILNTTFLVLCSSLMAFVLNGKQFITTDAEQILLISTAVFAMVFSQFALVPYDISSYFFLLLFFLFFLKYLETRSTLRLMIVALIMNISTLNRETSALSISLAGTLLFSKYGFSKKSIQPLLVLAVTFVAVYVGMRLFQQSFSTNDGNLLIKNFSDPKNLLGILCWLVFFVFTLLIAKDKKAVRHILLFHILSVPYIVMCLYSGILYEIRLYVPLFLTSLLLARLELTKTQ
ncbi:hypothetical protein [Kaistella palustris]|uniref:hypothetical protein n=1 Tax=Kaistella palustris TaxID=493376 RepID=UPI00041BA2AB|nr:hypothetical protein [Kaistella palustris]